MEKVSTIQLKKGILNELKKAKEYPRQTYNELLKKMITNFTKIKESTIIPIRQITKIVDYFKYLSKKATDLCKATPKLFARL